MERAVYLAQYFLGQARWMSSKQSLEEEGLTGIFAQIHAFALKTEKAIAARDVKQMVASLKKNSKATASWIRTMFSQLAGAGYGLISGEGIHLRYQAEQQNLQNGINLPNLLPGKGLRYLQNADNPNHQKSTSTNYHPTPMRLTLEDGKTLDGLGYYLETGEVNLTLEGGFKIVIPPEQHHCLGQVLSESPNVGPLAFVDSLPENVGPLAFVDSLPENVGPFVDSPINCPEASTDKEFEENVDLLTPSNPIYQQNQVPVQSQELLNQLQQCQNPQDFLKTSQQALTWIIGHLLNSPLNQPIS